MEVENVSNVAVTKHNEVDEDEDDMFLPGFRFHPTDEELVGFYLRRKVENKLVNLNFIKQIDIYKHDPWDLPKSSEGVGENEWYFFCKRGRKYKNSIRPNRVTGSGFWKATGIDRPIYSGDGGGGGGRQCIGLKKSLVYYRGSAGKGTKTEWMMHEFRLPPNKTTAATKTLSQEAEVWTLCRILKRKGIMGSKEIAPKRNVNNTPAEACSKTCSKDQYSPSSSSNKESFISFTNIPPNNYNNNNVVTNNNNNKHNYEERPFGINVVDNLNYHHHYHHPRPHHHPYVAVAANNNNVSSFTPEINEFLMKHGEWEDLRSVLGFSTDS